MSEALEWVPGSPRRLYLDVTNARHSGARRRREPGTHERHADGEGDAALDGGEPPRRTKHEPNAQRRVFPS
jgi:hypothetical protein